MGITLMAPEEYKNDLQMNGEFDENSWSWLLTHGGALSQGFAQVGSRTGDVYMTVPNARQRNVYKGWRGTLRVKKD